MARSNYFRTSDRTQYIDTKNSGFIVREKTPTTVLYHFFMAISLAVALVVAIFFHNHALGFYLLVGTGISVYFIGQQIEEIKRTQLSYEFLNAIFSSSLSKGYLFCLVARYDGEIIYMNHQFQEQFDEFMDQSSLNIPTLCNIQQVPRRDAERIAELMAQEKESSHTFKMIVGPYKDDETVQLLIEPTGLPRGYVLLRAKIVKSS